MRAEIVERISESRRRRETQGANVVFGVFAPARNFRDRRSKECRHYWTSNPEIVNGGVNHFGSPFNFPEEFVPFTGCTRWFRT